MYMVTDNIKVSTPVAISALVVSSFYLFWWPKIKSKLEEKKPFENLSMPGNSHWLFGHRGLLLGDFRKTYKILLQDYANEYGQTGFWILSTPVVGVTDWKDAATVFKEEMYRKRLPFTSKHLNNFLGPRNIGVLHGREWRIHRAAITRSVGRPNALKRAEQSVRDTALTMVNSIKNRIAMSGSTSFEVDDIESYLKMITIDVFGKFALNYDLECCKLLKPSEIAETFNFLTDELTIRFASPLKPTNYFYSLPTKRNREHKQKRKVLFDFLQELIADRRSSGKKDDLLSEILAGFKEEDDQIVDNQTLQEILLALLFAGYDTTSIALTYLMYLICCNPDAEKILVEEVSTQDHDPKILKYTEACLLEALRLYPPASANQRCLTKPIQLSGGLIVPKNALVFIGVWRTQRDPKTFPNPEMFRPDRWVKKEGKTWVDRTENDVDSSTIAPGIRGAILSFSGGARDCPGQRFAIQEAVLIIASLFKELHFQIPQDYEMVPERKGILHGPKGGLPVKIELR